MTLDLESFEGAYSEDEGGYHVIEKKGDGDYIKIPRLEEKDRILHCDFEILKDNVSKENIEELICIVLLNRFCQNFYFDKVDYVEFLNLKTREKWKIANAF